ncbi:hypothetical protein [Halopiger goleimassiliensis]|uniref:hypothetical protein n=1 Tax=Halopiger goleimassiliensis TaxID=1293048 RepID=UPI0012B618E5|nr:hypothetical protein [Halopiger goleimassiliensis]
MKKVVFSEGKHDVYLLELAHKKKDIGDNYDKYLTEEAKDDQTKRLRQHLADDQFEVLYKSEEGYGNLIKKFRSHSLMFTSFSLYILIDLDGDSLSGFFDDLNRSLTEEYQNKVEVVPGDNISNQDMVISDAVLKIEGSDNRSLPVMAFYESLEDVTTIQYSDDRSEKIRKIYRYMDNNPDICDDIISTIYSQ